MSVCPHVSTLWSHQTDFCERLYCKTFMKICWQNPDLIKIGQKYWGTLHQYLCMFYCCWRHKVTKQSLSSREMVLGWLGSWGGVSTTKYLNLMFCWPCIIAYRYNETNVMHFSFSLLGIKSLYMFRALLAHLQEALHKRHFVYCMHIMPVGCGTVAVSLPTAICAVPPEDEQVMLETCTGSWFSINWMKSASRWFHYTEILQNTHIWWRMHIIRLVTVQFIEPSITPSLLQSCPCTYHKAIWKERRYNLHSFLTLVLDAGE
jgi:hypothetical protein